MSPEHLAVLIPIIAIVMGLGLAMLRVVSRHRGRMQALEQRHRERMAALEKGLELPPDAVDPELEFEAARRERRPRYLLRGLTFLGIGLALILAWTGPEHPRVVGVGWIVLAIGAAQLLYYALEGRKETAPEPTGTHRP